MGTYGLEGVIRAWELEKLTTEQAIGQILQILVEFEGHLHELERRYHRINRTTRPRPQTKSQGSEEHEN